MIRSEGHDPQHYTISRRTTVRRRRHVRAQESPLSGTSSLVKSESRDFSTSDGGSSTDSEQDLYPYQHKKKRILQAYNKASSETGGGGSGAQESTSDGGSSSGSAKGSSPTKILGPTELQLRKSAGFPGYPTKAMDMSMNSAYPRAQSVPSPSNEVQIKSSEPFSFAGFPRDNLSSLLLPNVLKPLNQNSRMMNVPSYVADSMPLHPSSSPSTLSSSSRTSFMPPNASSHGNSPLTSKIIDQPTSASTNFGSTHYPFYLLVEAAVQIREIEIRMQQAAQWKEIFLWSSFQQSQQKNKLSQI